MHWNRGREKRRRFDRKERKEINFCVLCTDMLESFRRLHKFCAPAKLLSKMQIPYHHEAHEGHEDFGNSYFNLLLRALRTTIVENCVGLRKFLRRGPLSSLPRDGGDVSGGSSPVLLGCGSAALGSSW